MTQRRVVHKLVTVKNRAFPKTACGFSMTNFHVDNVQWYGPWTCKRCLAKRKK